MNDHIPIEGTVLRDKLTRDLEIAVAHHQAGRLQDAETIYRGVLRVWPDNPDALHLLGLIVHRMGRPDKAEELIAKAIAVKDGEAMYHSNLGLALQQQGKTDEAIAAYRRAIKLMPEFAEGHFNLGTLYKDAGDLEKAVKAFRKTVKLAPRFPDSHYALGMVYAQQDKPDKAAAAYQRLLALKPDHLKGIYNLAGVLRDLDKLDESADAYRRALAFDPDMNEAHNNLGITLAAQGKHKEAITHYRRALEIDPDHAGSYNNLGIALKRIDKLDQALTAHRRAVDIDPDSVETQCNLGKILSRLRRMDESVEAFDKAIALDPACTDAHLYRGIALDRLDKQDEARACFERVIELKPDLGEAYYNLASVKDDFAPDDPLLATMEELLNGPDFKPESRNMLLFGLGSAHNKAGQYDKAFKYFLEANTTKRQKLDYDGEKHSANVRKIIETFDKSLTENSEITGDDSELPIFVVGMPRSGKTLTERLLSEHPLVFGAGELVDLRDIVKEMPATFGTSLAYPDCMEALTPEQGREIGARYIAALRTHAPDDRQIRIVDTFPPNYHYLGLIQLVLPRARIIHCTREPFDNLLYCYFKNFKSVSYAFDQIELGQYYLHKEKLMAHWRKVLPRPILEVRYEDTIADPVAQSRRIYDYCGLDWDEAFARDDGEFPITVREGEVGRAQHYAEHLRPLFSVLTGVSV